MKSNNATVSLPIVTSGASVSVPNYDVSMGRAGFLVQTIGVAAGGASYKLQGSLDGGTTWITITGNLLDLGNAGTAIGAAVITADSIYLFPDAFPGLVRFLCTVAPSTGQPKALLGIQDSRQQ